MRHGQFTPQRPVSQRRIVCFSTACCRLLPGASPLSAGCRVLDSIRQNQFRKLVGNSRKARNIPCPSRRPPAPGPRQPQRIASTNSSSVTPACRRMLCSVRGTSERCSGTETRGSALASRTCEPPWRVNFGTQSSEGLDGGSPRVVPGQRHIRTRMGSLTKWRRMRPGALPSSK
jgi:hypothetical protein